MTAIFGKYEIIRRLAIGGMGEIFLARQIGIPGFDRLVILKSLLPAIAQEQAAVDEFLDEARVAAMINHPNVIAIYEVGRWEGSYFIAMEYVRGENLAELRRTSVAGKIKMPPATIARVLHDAALGLDHAHQATDTRGRPLNVVHRDISPQNIMVTVEGVTKVVDFGIAKAANRSSRTATGIVKGKVRYMAPEQLRGLDLDARTDQFSLGIVFWEMFTGQRIFQDYSVDIAVARAILREPIPPPSSVSPEVPAPLEAIVMRMLEKDPEARFPRCAAAAAEVAEYLKSQQAAIGPSEVGAFVRRVVGAQIEERTRDLTPMKDNFLISFGTGQPSAAAPTSMTHVVEPRASASPIPAAKTYATASEMRTQREPVRGTEAVPLPATMRVSASHELARPRMSSAARLVLGLALAVIALAAVFLVALVMRERAEAVPAVVMASPPPAAAKDVAQETSPPAPVVAAEAREPGAAGAVGAPGAAVEAPAAVEASTEKARANLVQETIIDIRAPEGAELAIDGRPRPEKVPAVITGVSPGLHRIRFTLPGRAPFERTIMLTAGSRAIVNETPPVADDPPPPPPATKKPAKPIAAPPVSKPAVAVEAAPPPPAVGADGFLTLNTTPWAKVAIDGKPSGSTPLFKLALPAGSHRLTLVNEGAGVQREQIIEIAPGKTLKLDLDLSKK